MVSLLKNWRICVVWLASCSRLRPSFASAASVSIDPSIELNVRDEEEDEDAALDLDLEEVDAMTRQSKTNEAGRKEGRAGIKRDVGNRIVQHLAELPPSSHPQHNSTHTLHTHVLLHCQSLSLRSQPRLH